MYDICAIPIPKLDVLMEDFSNIHELVNSFTSDYDRLIESRNTWEVFFEGYDDDPREIPDIPEVVNWIEKSVEEGIPWFYFMRAEQSSLGLLTFMTCCGAEHAPDYPQRYIFDRDRIMPFIKTLQILLMSMTFLLKWDAPLQMTLWSLFRMSCVGRWIRKSLQKIWTVKSRKKRRLNVYRC